MLEGDQAAVQADENVVGTSRVRDLERLTFDWLATGGVIPFNPATAVRPPKHNVKKGKTPELAPDEARALLDTIGVTTPIGLRERALIGLMVYSFGRISAATAMRVQDV